MTDQQMYKRLVRIQKDRKIAGVCTGLGAYFNADPAVFRIALIAMALMGGSGIMIYLIAWLVMPLQAEA
jgi:phage shock protein C